MAQFYLIQMFDTSGNIRLQRSYGRAFVRLGRQGVIDLLQSGCAKAVLPRVSAGLPEIVFLNTSGGLASEDRLEFGLELQQNTGALATTQTAERAYRAEGPPAQVQVRLRVGKGGWLDWLPQETIFYNGARLDRVTEIELDQGAGCAMLEVVVLGRLAMGEKLGHIYLSDRRTVRQEGRIIHHDALMLNDEVLSRLANPAMMNGAGAFATLVIISPHAADLLETARKIMNEPGVTAAASAPVGRLIVRLLAANGWPLHKQIVRLLAALRPDPLPRTWQT